MTRQKPCRQCRHRFSFIAAKCVQEPDLCESCTSDLNALAEEHEESDGHGSSEVRKVTDSMLSSEKESTANLTVTAMPAIAESPGSDDTSEDIALDIVLDSQVKNPEARVLLGEIRLKPQPEKDLVRNHGPETYRMIKNLRKIGYPIRYWPLKSPDGTRNLYYYDAKVDGRRKCAVCGDFTGDLGPFCSRGCEQQFVKNLSSQSNEGRSVGRPEATTKRRSSRALHAKNDDDSSENQHSTPGGKPLYDIIPAKVIMHLAKKAKMNNKLEGRERKMLVNYGKKLYDRRALTEGQEERLQRVLSEAVRNGLVNDGCQYDKCRLCKSMREALDNEGISYA